MKKLSCDFARPAHQAADFLDTALATAQTDWHSRAPCDDFGAELKLPRDGRIEYNFEEDD
jgi:hypothetical protein